MTFKYGQSHQNWYGEVELNIGYYPEKIRRLRRNSVQEKSEANVTVLVDTEHLSILSPEQSLSQ